MQTFPIMLDVRDVTAVVVGGGRVGMRKVRSLLAAGARVRLVSPETDAAIEPDERLEVIRDRYDASRLAGARLVFACTDDAGVNRRIAADARRAGALVNAADQPADCDFYMPAVIRDGDVIVAIGTGGSAPALASELRKRMTPAVPERIGAFALALSQLRETLLPHGPAGSRTLRRLAREGYELFLAEGEPALRERAEAWLAEEKAE